MYDDSALRIEGNNVTGLKPGNHTVKLKVNGVESDPVTITVKPTLSINGNNSINKDNNETATLTVNPSNASLNYDQNKLQIEDLGNGSYRVTGKTVGEHTITASLNGATSDPVTINVTENSSSGGESGGGSTGVETPDGYKLISVKELNQEISDNVEYHVDGPGNVDYIIVEYVSDGKQLQSRVWFNGDYNYSDDNKTYNQAGQILYRKAFDSTSNITKVTLKTFYHEGTDTIKAVYFYIKKPDPSISGAGNIIEGEELNLTANDFDGTDIVWSVTNTDGSSTNLAEIDQNGKLTATGGSGTVRVTATRTADGKTQSAYVDIEIDEFVLKFNTGEIYKEISLRKGKNTILEFNRNEDVTITWDAGYEQYLTVDGRNVTVKDVDGSQEIGFTATYSKYGGSTVEGKILIVGDLSISGESKTYTGRKLPLTANNAVGNVIWSIVDAGETEATISQSGVLTAGGKAGTVKIRVTDDEMTSEIFEIVIQPGCEEVDIEGMTDITHKFAEEGKNVIELTAADNWSKLLSGLEVYDANRDYYCYYIVECDEYGNPIKSGSYVTGSNGAMFVPTSYKNNGATIEKGQTSVIEVSNALSAKVEGQMPSTGGDGTTTYYSFGAIIMLLSAAGFIGLRRRQRSQRSE